MCLEDFIKLINKENDNLQLDYASFKLLDVVSLSNNLNININSAKNLIFQKIDNQLYPNTIERNILSQYANSDNVIWNDSNVELTNNVNYDIPFYNKYKYTVDSVMVQMEKLLYLINNKTFITQNLAPTGSISNTRLNDIYTTFKQEIYNQTITTLKNIYNNLQLSYYSVQANQTLDSFQSRIINLVFNVLTNYTNTNITTNTGTTTTTVTVGNFYFLLMFKYFSNPSINFHSSIVSIL